MRKLINTLLFGLLYLNLYAQTDKMELNPKHDKALYPKVFEYIRDTLLGGYPIGGTEKDMQNWAQNEFDNHFSFEYGHSNYASTLYEKRSYFLVKNAIQYDFSLVSSKSHVLLMLSNDDAFVEQIELHLTFNTAEDKIIYYEKVIYQLKSVFQFPISHVGTGTYTFDFEEGSVFITGYDLSDQRMSIRFRANEKQSKKTLAPTRYLKEKKLISGNEEPLSAEKALRLSLQRWKIDSINVKNENNKNPNCPNRCLRYNGESDCMYFSPFAYKGNSVEVLFARPKVAKKRELTESIVNFTSILKIDYKNIKEKTPTTEGIIELGYIDGSLYLHHINEGKSQLISLNRTLENGRWHHLAIVKQESLFLFYANGENLDVLIAEENGVQKVIRGFELTPHPYLEGQFFDGYLDEFRIWNRTLQGFEVRDYAFLTIKNHPDLFYNCHFDEGVPYGDNSNIKYIANSGTERSGIEFNAKSGKKGSISNYVCSDLTIPEAAVWSLPTVGTGQLDAPDMIVYNFHESLKHKNDNWKKYVYIDLNGKIIVPNIRLWTEMVDFSISNAWNMYYLISSDGNKADVRVKFEIKSRKIPEIIFEQTEVFRLQKINGVWKIVACPG